MKPSVRMGWALEQLRDAKVRITPVRERVLTFLCAHDIPITLHEIRKSKDLDELFDDATVYRALVLLVEIEVVRQLQFRDRAAAFLLNMPGECAGFLVCRSCGAVLRLPHTEQMRLLEQQTAALNGFTRITHELQLYGLCPQCQKKKTDTIKPNKMNSGMRLRRNEKHEESAI